MKKLILFSLLIIGCSNFYSDSQKIKSANEEINQIQEEITRLKAQVTESRLRLEDLELQLVNEIEGAVALGLEGFGPAAKRLEDMIAIAMDEYDSIKEINTNAIQLLEDEISLIRDSIYKLLN